MSDKQSPVLDVYGNPHVHKNGKPRPQLIDAMLSNGRSRYTAKATYDAARDTDEYRRHWANADALDSDSSNSRAVRHKLMQRSRYEAGSNGYYAGILSTHANMVVGVGPTLRMLTGNRNFNQLVEREFFKWAQTIQLRRKLWCMAHARTADGESFGILSNNPSLPDVQLDLLLIEAEQCQTPLLAYGDARYIDGIKFDEYGNVLWYDILAAHPGSSEYTVSYEAEKVSPSNVLHWFKLRRPGAHRSAPELTSTLNVGASSRRMREATVGAVETAASLGAALLKTQMSPNEVDLVEPMSTLEIERRMMTALPMGWDAVQMKSEHPNAQYDAFHRLQISEQARPLSMPYNAAACDSSTYSFASGKLDTLCYRAAIDVERQDCNDLVLDRIFAAWFREWTIVAERRDIPPAHQWDWPSHPVIDAVAEAQATDTKLKNGTTTLRQVYSDAGMDLEDQIAVMAEDMFGDSSEESITKARKIMVLKSTSSDAMQYVASLLGLETEQTNTQETVEEPINA
jgi:capsid protein